MSKAEPFKASLVPLATTSLLNLKNNLSCSLGNAAIGYAIGNWYFYSGEKEKAKTIFEDIVALDNWATFGYIAAEADLKRML